MVVTKTYIIEVVTSEKRIKNRLANVLRLIYFCQFELTLGAGEYSQTLNMISFIECKNVIELYCFIVMIVIFKCGFRVFTNTSLVNW